MTVSASPILHPAIPTRARYVHARTHARGESWCMRIFPRLSFLLPLASSTSSRLYLSFRFYSLSFRLVYRSPSISFVLFLRDPLTLPLSAALTRCDPLRIIARPNRPNGRHPSIGCSLSDALHLPADVESQNKRTTNGGGSSSLLYIYISAVSSFRNAGRLPPLFSSAFTAGFPQPPQRVFVFLLPRIILPLSPFLPSHSYARLFGNLRIRLFSKTMPINAAVSVKGEKEDDFVKSRI